MRTCLQDLVVASYTYTRVKHSHPVLMKAIGDAAVEVRAVGCALQTSLYEVYGMSLS